MTGSSLTKTVLLAGGALLGVTGLCQAQTYTSRQTEQELAAHKDIAKANLKGELLEGYNKALTRGSPADLNEADRIRVDAEAVAQCNAVLEKAFPHFQQLSLRMRREYRRLQSENQALRAEYSRLKSLPKWAARYQLESSYDRRLAQHVVAYKIYLAKNRARNAMLLGLTFCIRVIQRHDPALGARWSGRMRALLAGR
jgi:hypothetical protein